MADLFGLIEAGGTKVVVGVGSAVGDIRAKVRIPTTTPAETLGAVIAWLRGAAAEHGPLTALGVACFGPLDLDRASPRWGFITRTVKPGWNDTDVAGPLAAAFGCPVGFDTDVNGAALAEHRWGAGRGHEVSVYVTVGTGIGGGAIVDGKPVQGAGHPEMGHFHLPRHPDDGDFAGVCSFHGDCLEGLASGPAIAARWGASLSELPPGHPAHAIEAHYLAHAAVALQAILAPGVIVLGGGVMAAPGLLDAVRAKAAALAGDYFPDVLNLAAPALGGNAGLLGALALAQDVQCGSPITNGSNASSGGGSIVLR
ncbi:MAG: ROK family protein [Sphingomonadaceae bacterium]|nr:ROK family protein [Sphingomonadaceae bacterium]